MQVQSSRSQERVVVVVVVVVVEVFTLQSRVKE